LETFLTDIQAMPNATQNKLLQEKITLLHEKVACAFEEL
jgi:hypothetical protein